MTLQILSYAAAQRLLCQPALAANVTHIISIGDPLCGEPCGVREHPCWQERGLRLEFDDIERWNLNYDRPFSWEQMDKLISFAQGIPAGTPGVLVHCQQGLSRSTAAAVILRLAQYSQMRGGCTNMVASVVAEVKALVPESKPNRRMIWMADQHFGLCGQLKAAYRLVWPQRSEDGIEVPEAQGR